MEKYKERTRLALGEEKTRPDIFKPLTQTVTLIILIALISACTPTMIDVPPTVTAIPASPTALPPTATPTQVPPTATPSPSPVATTSSGTVPVLETIAVSGATSFSALSGGNITSEGEEAVTVRGVCWSTNPMPTISDSKTMNGNGGGSYTSWVTKLEANMTYYLRAYATNSAGTGYGNTVTVTTSPHNRLEYFGQTPPGKTLISFAQNIIGNWEHGEVTFSPDGLEAYWTNRSYILTSKVENGRWTAPSVISFSGQENPQRGVPYDDNPVVSPDNTKLFFTSLRPIGFSTPNREHIWYVERTPTGWGEPKPLPQNINSVPGLHWLISITNDGTIYFGANLSIYFARFTNGTYTDPQEVSVINSFGGGCNPFVAPDESYIIFSDLGGTGTYISFKDNNGQWLPPQLIAQLRGTNFVTRDGKYIFSEFRWVSTDILEDYRPAAPPPTVTMMPSPSSSAPGTISADTVGQVELLSTLDGHNDNVYALDFSSDSVHVASSGADKEVKLWNVWTGELVHTISLPVATRNNMAFSPARNLFASANTLWDAQSWQVLQRFEGEHSAVTFSPDGSLLAIAPAGQPIMLWDVAAGQVVRTFDDPVENLFRSIVFSPDDIWLAAGSNNNIIRLWDVVGGGLVHTIQHDAEGYPLDHILDLAFSPDGRVLASGGTDAMVRLWDVETWQVIHELSVGDAPTGLAFSPDGTSLASSGSTLRLWDVENGKLLRTLPHSDVITVAFSPDGTMLASGGYDQKVYLWGLSR